MTRDSGIDLTKSKTHWSLSIKLRRGLWTWCLEPIVRWLPKVCSPARIGALRLMGARIGKGCLILPGTKVLMPWNLQLADYVALGERVNIYNFSLVSVGRMSVVSQFCYLCTGTHDYTRPDMPLVYRPIKIGSDSWIAAGVFIGPGVTVADGVVVGAMSVVPRPIPDEWTVWAGNPARRIKDRRIKDPSHE